MVLRRNAVHGLSTASTNARGMACGALILLALIFAPPRLSLRHRTRPAYSRCFTLPFSDPSSGSRDYHITATTIVGIFLAMAGNIVMFSNGDFTLLALGRKADGWRKAKQDGSNDNRLREQGPQIMSLRISSDHFPLLFVPSPMSQNEAYGK